MKSKTLEIAGAGLVAAVVIACGEAAMNGGAGMMGGAGGMLADAGEMMMEAGQMMTDAGAEMMRDAGAMMMDAGGGMMRDAGEMMRDAGEMMRDASAMMGDASDMMNDSAMAQSCEACTAGGRRQVITADQDLEQLRGGTIERGDWTEVRSGPYELNSGTCATTMYESRVHTAVVAEGPLVITDARSNGDISIFAVPSGAPCHEAYSDVSFLPCGTGYSMPFRGDRFRRPQSSRSLLLSSQTSAARVVVPAGETVCALTNARADVFTTTEPSIAPAIIVWSGFVPYE